MHIHTTTEHNSALDCTQSASRRQVLTFPKCLHSTCELALPQYRVSLLSLHSQTALQEDGKVTSTALQL